MAAERLVPDEAEPAPRPPLTDPERAAMAAELGRGRRRLWLVGLPIGLLAPILPYLTGTWETIWYGLAGWEWPLPLRVALFLPLVHLLLAGVSLPLAHAGYRLAVRFGLSRQTGRQWLADWLKAVLLGTAVATIGGGLFVWSVATFDTAWWVAFGVGISAGILLMTFLVPYVVVPLFFKMKPLEDRAVVERVHAVAQRAGAQVQAVCTLDFSRRTAEANAAVIGFGRSRRVVLADTLLAEFAPDEVDAVVAHELGHHVHRDVPRLLALSLGLTWLGLALGAWAAPWALPLLSLPSLAYVPGYPVLLAVAEAFWLLLMPVSNSVSRRIESAADRFALRVTGQPVAFANAMRRLATQNLIEMQPPRWAEVLLASHPPVYRRVAMAERWSAK